MNTRYYDPVTGRFISADGYVATGQGIIGNNMYAYCNNNPVMFVDPNGDSFLLVLGPAAYAVAVVTTVVATVVLTKMLVDMANDPVVQQGVVDAYHAIVNAFDTTESKSESKEEITISQPSNSTVYYHATTMENANAIMASGKMYGSLAEGGYVYAWRCYPDKKAIRQSGAQGEVIISFTTSTPFETDPAFTDDSHAYKYHPVRSVFPGPISVKNVQIVGN